MAGLGKLGGHSNNANSEEHRPIQGYNCKGIMTKFAIRPHATRLDEQVIDVTEEEQLICTIATHPHGINISSRHPCQISNLMPMTTQVTFYPRSVRDN
jgi:hypothetical protein